MTDVPPLLVDCRDHVARLILNRPERLNALDKATLVAINDALDRVEADDDIRAVVLSGAGRAFSSGFDLKAQMEARPEGAAAWREILDLDFDTTMRFWHCPKPTIAVPHITAGCFEAFAISFISASQSARRRSLLPCKPLVRGLRS